MRRFPRLREPNALGLRILATASGSTIGTSRRESALLNSSTISSSLSSKGAWPRGAVLVTYGGQFTWRLTRQALETIRTEYGPLFAPRNLAVRRNGDALSVSYVLPMPPAMSIAEAHATGEQAEKALRTRLAALERVVIRVE
jgi:hypothetical protein